MEALREYCGHTTRVLPSEELELLSRGRLEQDYGLLENEYLVAEDVFRCFAGQYALRNGKLEEVPYKQIHSRFLGNIKSRNREQQLAVDLLYNNEITIKILTGKFGTGKDYLMTAVAIDLLEQNQYEKIVYVRNNIEVKNSKPIGHLPGSYNEKLAPFAAPLADHLGGYDGLDLMISKGKVEIVHLGFMRGRDIKNSIILCSEAENMTKEHIQLLIGRVGEGSSLWLNGDFKQCDAAVFQKNNGLITAIDKLKGHKRFGYVKLIKTERSETASMADLLD